MTPRPPSRLNTDVGIYKACPTKKARRTKAEVELLKDAMFSILEAHHPQTVRGLFYQMVRKAEIEKTEAAYQGIVVRLSGEMRERGELPWDWLADSTRWMRKPDSYSSLEEAIALTAETYRRALWDNQNAYVEIWCEKEALAGVLYEITQEYDVPLMIVRGFASKDFAHGAAESIENKRKPAFLYYFGDWDPSGLLIWQDIQHKVLRYAPHADVSFERVAVSVEQITRYKLPTRPTKRQGNFHAKHFRGDSVEVDALPPGVLQQLVRNAIERHIDRRQLAITRRAEESEREALIGWHLTSQKVARGEAPPLEPRQ